MKAITLLESLTYAPMAGTGIATNYVGEPATEFLERMFAPAGVPHEVVVKEGRLLDPQLIDYPYFYAYGEPLSDPRPGRTSYPLPFDAKVVVTDMSDEDLQDTIYLYKID